MLVQMLESVDKCFKSTVFMMFNKLNEVRRIRFEQRRDAKKEKNYWKGPDGKFGAGQYSGWSADVTREIPQRIWLCRENTCGLDDKGVDMTPWGVETREWRRMEEQEAVGCKNSKNAGRGVPGRERGRRIFDAITNSPGPPNLMNDMNPYIQNLNKLHMG